MKPSLFQTAFDFKPATRVVFGANAVEQVGTIASEFSRGRIMLVTDPGLVSAGHAGKIQQWLERAGLQVACFNQVEQNPTTRCVEACLEMAKKEAIDAFVALGGGSAMDTAKGCNFLLTNGGTMKDYWGVGKATKPMLPLIAIPTTAGTGSEMQSAALISDPVTHQKMACLDPKALARVAILDPVLTLSQPARVAACTGIDTIAHAVESAVCRKRNAVSWMYSSEAFRLANDALPEVLKNPGNLEARGAMLWAAALAGCAIENSMLGAAHSASNPLTAHYGIVHGQAVGMMLPHVVRFNASDPAARAAYAQLAMTAAISSSNQNPEAAAAALAMRLTQLLECAGLPVSLADCQVSEADIPMLAEEAARQWTANFNPRPIGREDFIGVYRAAFGR